MEGFTLIDGVVGAVVLISAFLAFSRGFAREMMAIVGWIVAFLIAFSFAGTVKPLIAEIPYADTVLRGSCELSVVAAFVAVLAIALFVLSFFTPLLTSMFKNYGPVKRFDQMLGFLFGVLRGVLIIAVGFILYDRVTGEDGIAMVENSQSSGFFAGLQGGLESQLPEDVPGWVLTRYEALVSECAPAEEESAEAAELEITLPEEAPELTDAVTDALNDALNEALTTDQ